MKKTTFGGIIQILISFSILTLLLSFNYNRTSSSSTISGDDYVFTGSQKYYEASFTVTPDPLSIIYWSVTGGTIISQNVDPNNGVIYCNIEWGTTPGTFSVSIYEDLGSQNSEKQVHVLACSDANAGTDVTICSGNSTTIGTTAVSLYSYSWYPTTGLNNPNIAQPTASPTQTTTYTLVKTPINNMITNGDFENGYSSFGSDYPVLPTTIDAGGLGYQVISSNPHSLHSGWCTMPDFSATGSNMLITDGPVSHSSLGYRFWFTDYTVQTYTDYYFSVWVSNVNNTYESDIRLTVTGNNTGATTSDYNVPVASNCNTWLNCQYTWNSGSNTHVNLDLRFTTTIALGNDLAVDDLFFGTCHPSTDEVIVTVSDNTPSVSPSGTINYYNVYESYQNVVLTCDQSPSYQWYKNGNSIGGATSQTFTINCTGLSDYTDYYYCITSCGTSNTVTFNYYGCDDVSDYPVSISFTNAVCSSSFPVTLYAPNLGAGTTYQWWAETNPTNFSFNNFSSNTCNINFSGCSSFCTDGVYTKSTKTGVTTYMYYTITGNNYCKSNPLIPQSENSNSIFSGISALPNPANLTITFNSPVLIKQIEIFNLVGILVRKIQSTGTTNITLNTSNLQPGIYICKLVTEKGNTRLRFVIQR